jgi:hypothetical protein
MPVPARVRSMRGENQQVAALFPPRRAAPGRSQIQDSFQVSAAGDPSLVDRIVRLVIEHRPGRVLP